MSTPDIQEWIDDQIDRARAEANTEARSASPFQRCVIVVSGKGDFPLDMLRYDNCSPYAEVDANAMQHQSGHRRIRLYKYFRPSGKETTAEPNPERWYSYHWSVISVDSEALFEYSRSGWNDKNKLVPVPEGGGL